MTSASSSKPLGHHLKATLWLGTPLVGSYVAQMAVGLTDTLMLGWYGVPELAAVTIAASYFFVIFIAGTGFAQAVLPKVAAADAQDDPVTVRRVTRMGIWLSVLYAVLSAPLFIWSGPILLRMGQTPEVAELGQQYLHIAGAGILPALIMAALRSHLSGLERAGIVMWATIAAAVLNAIVNYALIFGNWGAPELGVRGAAIASLAVQTTMAAGMAIYAINGPGMARYDLFVRLWRPDWPVFFDLARLGFPISLTLLAETGLFAASAVMMGWIGTVELAAHGIALSITSATFMVHLGLSAAGTVRVGAAHGRGDAVGIKRAATAALILSGLFVAITIAVFLISPEPLMAAFVDPDDPAKPQILILGATLLAVAALFQLVDAGQVMALGFLRGLQDTGWPMVFAVLGYWIIGMPASYAMAFHTPLGPAGLWLGLCVGLTVAGVAMNWRFWTSPALR